MAKGRKLIIAALVALSACQGQPPAVVQEDHLVVEAWICSGQPPMVQLTSSIQPREQNQDVDALDEHVIRRAKVSISDGENEVTLTGMPWKGCLPPYVYTTSRMIGEEGKTYTLTVETSTHKARAVTTIPAAVPLTSMVTERYGERERAWLIRAYFTDRPGEHNYYKFFSRVHGVDSTFYPTRLNLIDDEQLPDGADASALILRGARVFSETEVHSFFPAGTTVHLRFCSMNEDMAGVWRTFDTDAIQASIPILSSYNNVPGNVEGALGYFAGYGCTEYSITMPDE